MPAAHLPSSLTAIAAGEALRNEASMVRTEAESGRPLTICIWPREGNQSAAELPVGLMAIRWGLVPTPAMLAMLTGLAPGFTNKTSPVRASVEIAKFCCG